MNGLVIRNRAPASLAAARISSEPSEVTHPNGTWTLEVEDTEVNDGGALNSWSLNIQAGERAATTSAQGAYSFESMAPGSYVIRQVVRFIEMPADHHRRAIQFLLHRRDDGGHAASPQARCRHSARVLQRARKLAQFRRSNKPPDRLGRGP